MRVLKWIGIVFGVLVALLFGAISYFKSAAAARYDRVIDVKAEDIPIPFPLGPREIEALREKRRAELAKQAPPSAAAPAEAEPAAAKAEAAPAAAEAQPTVEPAGAAAAAAQPAAAPEVDPLEGVDLHAIALERAIARGKRYVETRAGCTECHGDDFTGKVIIDNPVMGKWVAPNITRGGLTKSYTGKDWVRILRHGVRPDGHPATMPSMDFTWFSDQEISDIAAYIHSVPASSKEMEPTVMGPVFAMLIARGEIPISADVIDHEAKRAKFPPDVEPTLELGKHLGTTCTGCHGPGLSGGPIRGGDPSWPPAKNLTFDDTGIGKWSLDDFRKAMKQGVRPDGTALKPPMVTTYTARLEDAEVEALYIYLKSMPPKPYGTY